MADTGNYSSWGLSSREFPYRDALQYPTSGCGDFQDSTLSDSSNPFSVKSGASKDVETRFVNPAIYVEPLKNSPGDATELCGVLPNLSLNDDASNICRTQSLTSSITPSFISPSQSNLTVRAERRCRISEDQDFEEISEENQKYSVNGERTQITGSLSTTNLSAHEYSSRVSLPRQLAHEEWMQKKKLEILHQRKEAEKLEAKKKVEDEKLARERGEREQREQENFQKWSELKKQEEATKRKLAEKKRQLIEKLIECKEKAAADTEICLRQWALKKDKAQKAQKHEQAAKLKKLEEEKKKRLDKSVKAFDDWRERSKNTPKPATQGLLPYQKAKPSYVNPIPWVTDDAVPEAPKKLQVTRKPNKYTRNRGSCLRQ